MNMRFIKAFDLDVFLRYNMFYGFYHNISERGFNRFLFKIISVVISAVLLWNGIQFEKFLDGDINTIGRAFEYIIYVLCALITGNDYLIKYYKAFTFEDKIIYQKMHELLMKYIILVHVLYFILYFMYLYTKTEAESEYQQPWLNFLFMGLFRLGTELGRMPVIVTLYLLYCRIQLLTKKIRIEALQLTSTFQWKKYVNNYIKQIESLEKTEWPVKLMIFVHLIFVFIRVCTIQFSMVVFYKNNAMNSITAFFLIERIIQLIYIYTSLVSPSLIMELALKEIDTLKAQLADEMITCTDERRKTQLRKILNCFRSYPLTYTIWRTLEVNARLPLGLFSLSTTCIICLLQFHHVLET